MPRAQIKDEKTYRALRREGNSEEKAARIANAAAGSSRKQVGKKGGKSPSYADWSKEDLVKRAREIVLGVPALLYWQGVEGRRAFGESANV